MPWARMIDGRPQPCTDGTSKESSIHHPRTRPTRHDTRRGNGERPAFHPPPLCSSRRLLRGAARTIAVKERRQRIDPEKWKGPSPMMAIHNEKSME